ncbi:MAG TPA: S8 family serine peptidase [Gammaproteobacteria bacterium]
MKIIYNILAIFMVVTPLSHVQAAEVSSDVYNLMATADVDQDIAVIIRFRDRLDVKAIRDSNIANRRGRMVRELKFRSFNKQKRIRALLNTRLSNNKLQHIKHLWMINAISARLPASIIAELTRHQDIESITLDAVISPLPQELASPALPEWNLITIGANTLWDLGFTGQGIVVGSMDTGVDMLHQDLAGRWRGGSNSWFDPFGEHNAPYDADGHGTQTMGIMVGGNVGGSSIGVAPSAQWIAAKIFNDAGTGNISSIHEAFQWMLDPDNNPDTDDAPDIVNNAWNLQNTFNSCNTEFQDDINVLRNAEIAVVFSAGNTGPYPSSSLSPANNAGSFETGAVDSSLNVVYSSGRGPSACDGGIYPQISAPGFNIRTTDLTFGGILPDLYTTVSGTSFAAAHVTGAMALLKSAVASSSVDEIESALTQSAVDVGSSGADNDYGFGVINVTDAYQLLQFNNAPIANDDYATTVRNYPVIIHLLENDTDIDGQLNQTSISILSQPSRGVVVDNGDGTVTYTSTRFRAGIDTFSYSVRDDDGVESNSATVSIDISRR